MTLAFCARLAIAIGCLGLAGCTSLGETGLGGNTPSLGAGQGAGQGPGLAATHADGTQSWLIPSPVAGTLMQATLHLPPGRGPFPLAVVNHGSEQDPVRRTQMPPPRFPALTDWLLSRNYAVLVPLRPGHGATGGRYLEDQGPCNRADFIAAGNGAADSIAAAVDYMSAQSFVRRDGVLVVGNSAGGWGTLALAARNPPKVGAVVAFAPGRGGRDRDRPGQNCSPDRLVEAARTFGATSRLPALMLYAENDTYFPPALSARVGAAFQAGDASATFRLLPPVGSEGHALIEAPSAWSTDVERFLEAVR